MDEEAAVGSGCKVNDDVGKPAALVASDARHTTSFTLISIVVVTSLISPHYDASSSSAAAAVVIVVVVH